ncbi:iron-siderophore ABC transporter substrate-binding protein [Kribbella sp. CA-293567]|uniref:iron-siderophore ABC transporter substrate-binding protein n=1 Tax=Kribbella sp. CA-293567 TaxID=3002436 RepID=UPI0022DE69A2|nr:iron-siderophore ABC transporter substrate-binding protein [Kribbella sp. CA-293567]WBQ04177.1 iron-siderophore ABC transporter substrate-binding protein [Kribbella sp. CA-293567]
MRSILRPLALLAALPLLALTACGGGGQEDEAARTQSSADAGAFPVSIKNKFGTAEIKSAPQRIVVVGLIEQDALLALGVTPVATTEWFGDKPGALFPWAKAKLGDGAVPQVLKDKDGIQFEQIAALRPDLIIGLYAGITAADYQKLTALAPTVAQLPGSQDYGVAWQDVTRTVGQAVGKPKEADELVKGIEGRFEKVRAEHPEFKGKTALMASPYEGYFIYGSQDPRSRLLTDLGFVLPADLDKAIGDKFGANISAEKAALLDQQAIVWFPTKGGTAKLKEDKVYRALNARKQGRDVFIEEDYDSDLYGATTFVSILSLPIVLDQLVPQLAKAVDGDPTTT